MQKPFKNLRYLMEASERSWESVDKTKLPAACFLWVEDPKKKSTWHLPVYEGAGGIDSDTGMYKSRGQLNLNALRAASGAIAGARAGSPMNIPASVRATLTALLKANKIGQFAESKEILEAKEGDITITGSLKEAVIDRENKIIKDVVLLTKTSLNNREYTADCRRKALSLFEGAKAFYNHIKKGETHRDVRDLIGKYQNVREDGDKIKGDLHLIDGTESLLSVAERMPDVVGNSIHGQGRYKRENGKDIVDEITKVHSVDVVTDPATTVSLFEEKTTKEGKTMEWKDITVTELQANRLDVYESITAEGAASRDEEIKTLKEERDSLKKENDVFKVKESLSTKKGLVEKALSESKLPKEAKTETFTSILMAVEEKKEGDKTITVAEQIKTLIEDRMELVKPKGVRNAGGDKTVITEGTEMTKEDFAKQLLL